MIMMRWLQDKIRNAMRTRGYVQGMQRATAFRHWKTTTASLHPSAVDGVPLCARVDARARVCECECACTGVCASLCVRARQYLCVSVSIYCVSLCTLRSSGLVRFSSKRPICITQITGPPGCTGPGLSLSVPKDRVVILPRIWSIHT